ncbi:hypothetical protein ACFQH6_16185 [Halobacteriaceae archaeon GCM10025711]
MTLTRTLLVTLALLTLFVGAGTARPTTDAVPTAQAGPPTDLPGPVPDFVEDVLHTIQEFVDGALDGALGPAVSDEAGGNPSEQSDSEG